MLSRRKKLQHFSGRGWESAAGLGEKDMLFLRGAPNIVLQKEAFFAGRGKFAKPFAT